MRAIVLLCLLHAAFGDHYDWDGPQNEDMSTPPYAEVCGPDSNSCGCCLMVQEVDRLKTHFNTSLTELEELYDEIISKAIKYKESRTAFSVALYNGESMKCLGPFRDDRIIKYMQVFLNMGGAYNMLTGIVTIPHSGVYVLALTTFSDAGAPGGNLAACAGLQINGMMLLGSKEKNNQDQEDSTTFVVALHLKAGDKVSVELPAGCFLCDDKSHYNTFSGFLLYGTE